MPKKNRIARISITLPEEVLREADRLAGELDRPRSWVLAEGVRRMARPPAAPVVREPVVSPYAGYEQEMETARLRRLKADLERTPEERLQDADDLLRLSRAVHPPRQRAQVIAFESYEEYDEWKTAHRAVGASRRAASSRSVQP